VTFQWAYKGKQKVSILPAGRRKHTPIEKGPLTAGFLFPYDLRR